MEQELTARIAGLEEKVAASLRRIERLEKGQTALNKLATAVEVLATKAPVTLFNGVVAVICAALLYTALTPALRKAHVLPA